MNEIKTKHYSIHIGDIWQPLNKLLSEKAYGQIGVLVDENTERYCLPAFEQFVTFPFKTYKIPAGEAFKTLDTCKDIWQFLMDENFTRNGLLINLGGGVIGDMGGFCASTFKRGIDFVQIPTTLLAQVDASVGGKLGIDFSYVKNAVGVFNDPQAVLIHPPFLDTLPDKELRSGFAEMIKHSLIADKKHWEQLCKIETLNAKTLAPHIRTSVQIKKAIVEADPFEKNVRKLLNFGHTAGHAIESQALEAGHELAHGEAVAIGIICEAFLSRELSGLPDGEFDQICSLIRRIYPGFSKIGATEQLLELMKKDKKNTGKEINFSMLKEIGHALINQHCDEQLIKKALDFYTSVYVY